MELGYALVKHLHASTLRAAAHAPSPKLSSCAMPALAASDTTAHGLTRSGLHGACLAVTPRAFAQPLAKRPVEALVAHPSPLPSRATSAALSTATGSTRSGHPSALPVVSQPAPALCSSVLVACAAVDADPKLSRRPHFSAAAQSMARGSTPSGPFGRSSPAASAVALVSPSAALAPSTEAAVVLLFSHRPTRLAARSRASGLTTHGRLGLLPVATALAHVLPSPATAQAATVAAMLL